MKKFILISCVTIFITSLTACTKVNHTKNTIVQMNVIDKLEDNTYKDGYDNRYNVKLSYNKSIYIIKNRDIFNNVKLGDYIDVLYITEYDKNNNVINVKVKAINR